MEEGRTRTAAVVSTVSDSLTRLGLSFGFPLDEIEKNGPPAQLAMAAENVLEEYLMSHDFIKLDGEPRLVIHEGNR